MLMESPFLYVEYWRGGYTDTLQGRINKETDRASKRIAPWNAKPLAAYVGRVFERVYVLRNQIVHGSAKYGSGANRGSVEPAVSVLRELVPLFRTLVRDSDADKDWGELPYPAKGRPGHPKELRTK